MCKYIQTVRKKSSVSSFGLVNEFSVTIASLYSASWLTLFLFPGSQMEDVDVDRGRCGGGVGVGCGRCGSSVDSSSS